MHIASDDTFAPRGWWHITRYPEVKVKKKRPLIITHLSQFINKHRHRGKSDVYNTFQGPPNNRKLQQESGELCSLYNSNPAKLAEVWCLNLCAGTLFVLLLKFGAILSIICGFLMAVSWWRCILQCIIITWSFLRLLKLCKLVVCKLDREGVLLDHGLNLNWNIPSTRCVVLPQYPKAQPPKSHSVPLLD